MLETMALPPNKKIDGSSIFAIDKLWENPTYIDGKIQPFGEENVYFDTHKYNLVLIVFSYTGTVDEDKYVQKYNYGCTTMVVPIDYKIRFMKQAIRHRNFYFSDNYIHFYQGQNGTNLQDDVCVPIAIYGIKLPINDLSQL